MHETPSQAEAAAHGATEVADGSGAMFDKIARRYDRLNRVLSLGMDRRWRRAAARALALESSPEPAAPRVLDLATGTGDLALDILQRYPKARVDGVDPAGKMLAIAQDKATRHLAHPQRLALHEGRGEALPFEDNSFCGATIAFGIRNVPDRPAGLQEMARVVRPGGRVVVLELIEPRGYSPVALGAKFWVHLIVPRLGALLSSRREYRYLQQSIEAFPPPSEFAQMMGTAGLEEVRIRKLACGTVALFVGKVPGTEPPAQAPQRDP